jgi:hypothetical protein
MGAKSLQAYAQVFPFAERIQIVLCYPRSGTNVKELLALHEQVVSVTISTPGIPATLRDFLAQPWGSPLSREEGPQSRSQGVSL